MKLSLVVLSSVYAEFDDKCYAKSIVISGSYFRSNMLKSIENTYSPQSCQVHCQQWAQQGCEYFVFDRSNNECALFHDMYNIHFDASNDQKYVGQREECLPCFRKGWDYIVTGSGNNIAGHRYIERVPSVGHCAAICKLVTDCKYVSFDTQATLCYLKDKDAHEGRDGEIGFQSTSIDTCPSIDDCEVLTVSIFY